MSQLIDPYSVPVPSMSGCGDAGGYSGVPINNADPRYTEPLVCLKGSGIAGKSYYYQDDGENPPYGYRVPGSLPEIWCRASVLQSLRHANTCLKQYDAEVFVWDAYRTVEAQKALWRHVECDVRQRHPEMNDAAVFHEVIKYVSNPHRFQKDDPQTWPVHATGGAVDLTLRSLATGELLDMGSGFDEICGYTATAAFEYLLSDGKCDADHPPLCNRRLLHWAMTKSGFINYPQEFWHFDRGTQLYVVNSAGTDEVAWYGYSDPPGME